MKTEGFGVLIVDDEPNIRSGLARGLEDQADIVETASDAEEALIKCSERQYQMAIVDIRLPGEMSGLDFVRRLRDIHPQTTAIVITAHGTVEMAVEAMRNGAFDFITKPLDLSMIRHQVRKAREHHELRDENKRLRDQLAHANELSNIIGNSSVMQAIFEQVRQVASTDATVFIQGESGTGKELIARALHDLSDRSGGPLVAVNLGALPETLLESELFGHEKGSFSGAVRRKPGCFERAAGGTLFLDEITEMPAKSQIDLLRVLETHEYMRVGGEEQLFSNVRIISATNRNVEPLIDEGTFREDLYYRLNVVPIILPALRDRRDDIPLLVDHFLTHFCQRHNRAVKRLSPDAMASMMAARWPGNIRQLRNVVERVTVTVNSDLVQLKDLPAELTSKPNVSLPSDRKLNEIVENAEKEAISGALQNCDFHRENTAKQLGISIRTLHYKMSRYGIH
jgi:DNA-binding NtrC family response regulator